MKDLVGHTSLVSGDRWDEAVLEEFLNALQSSTHRSVLSFERMGFVTSLFVDTWGDGFSLVSPNFDFHQSSKGNG